MYERNWQLSVNPPELISVLQLQCVDSATRGRTIVLSPATSLCLDMRENPPVTITTASDLRTPCTFMCVSEWEMMQKQKRTKRRGWKAQIRRQTATGWQLPVGVPWLWKALFAEIHPHPLTHMSVDLHQAAHSPVTYLTTTKPQEFISNLNKCWSFLEYFLYSHSFWDILFKFALYSFGLMHQSSMAGFSALLNAATRGRPVYGVWTWHLPIRGYSSEKSFCWECQDLFNSYFHD